jgi:hypothetical protein
MDAGEALPHYLDWLSRSRGKQWKQSEYKFVAESSCLPLNAGDTQRHNFSQCVQFAAYGELGLVRAAGECYVLCALCSVSPKVMMSPILASDAIQNWGMLSCP